MSGTTISVGASAFKWYKVPYPNKKTIWSIGVKEISPDRKYSKELMDGARLSVWGSKLVVDFIYLRKFYSMRNEFFECCAAKIKCKYPYAVLKGTILASDFEKMGIAVPKEELYTASPYLNFYIFIVEPKQ